MRVLLAGAVYFGVVFVAAFALGTVRTFWLEPALGETLAVACETPFLIAAMYLTVRHVLPRVSPPRTALALFAVGVIGLALQQVAEYALIRAASESYASHLAYLTTPAGMIYVGALVVFVIMPMLVLRSR
jgi:hypothetical protein